jgi:hypothetical protein
MNVPNNLFKGVKAGHRIRVLITLMATTAVLFLGSCTDEQKLEKRLHSGDGRWNIDEVQLNVWIDTILALQDTTFNLGTYTFEKEGSGFFFNALDTTTRAMFWANSADEVAIVVGQDKTVWTVRVDESNKQEWYAAYPRIYPDGSTDSVELFQFLSR